MKQGVQLAVAVASLALLAGVVWVGLRGDAPPERPLAASAEIAPRAAAPVRPKEPAPARGGPAVAPDPLPADDTAAPLPEAQLVVVDAAADWAEGADLDDETADAVTRIYAQMARRIARITAAVADGVLDPPAADRQLRAVRDECRAALEERLAPDQLKELRRAVAAADDPR